MAVVLFRAHEDTDFSRRALHKLRMELPHLEVVVVFYLSEAPAPVGIFEDAYVVTTQSLHSLPYPAALDYFDPDDFHTGIFDLPVLKFFRDHPGHDFYWVVEFDVFYAGDWNEIFQVLSESSADLLATTVLSKTDNPQWVHWPLLELGGVAPPLEHCIKSFIPFARVSTAALRVIDEFYRKGLKGHGEATWPTACSMRGLSIEDIGGNGPFTPERWRGKHYSNTALSANLCPGTFIFRPIYAEKHVENAGQPPMLWHPVKS